MAAITITAASVQPVSGISYGQGTAGGTIGTGMPVYIDASDSNKVKVCDSNASDAAAACVGIAAHPSVSGQPIRYYTAGIIAYGAVFTQGLIYVAGATAGGDINPASDLTTGWRTTILGVAKTTANLELSIFPSSTTV